MPLVRCQIHGLKYVAFSCEHITAAVDRLSATTPELNIVLDGAGYEVMLCDRCSENLRPPGPEPREGLNHRLDAPTEGRCGGCLLDWYRGTGRVDLLERLGRGIDP